MKRLYVLFDAQCAMCVRCRDWLARQPAFVQLQFIALTSPEAGRLVSGLGSLNPGEQLVVIADTGAVYRGASAWIMCLWALERYRLHARRLSNPALLPFARVVCELLARNRFRISRAFFDGDALHVATRLAPHAAKTQPARG